MCRTDAKLEGKVAIVTGGSAGIGFEAAKDLAYRGAKVVIASRNEAKLQRATAEITNATGNNEVTYRMLDLASLSSVRNFASEILQTESRLDILINNAGAIGLPDQLTEDGLNLTMQVNYFGAFLLTYLLLPLLKSSTPSRIINSSASSMYIGYLDFDHWNDIERYNIITALANSKLADAVFTVELSRRLHGTGVTVNSYDPFIVKGTDILENTPTIVQEFTKFFINLIGVDKKEAGRQMAYLATDPELIDVNGKHYKFCTKWFNHWLAHDEDFGKRLWDASKKAVMISEEENFDGNVPTE